VTDFLRAASSEPSALVIEGEPGIGKSTVWLGAIDKAREAGFVVLSTYPAAAESVLAYSALADLLGGSDPAVVARLPAPQRLAVDQVLLRGTSDGSGTDQRAVAAGFVSIIEDLAGDAPVLLAIDDLQWVDQSSAHVVAFAARRLLGPVGVLATARTQPDGDDPAFWLQLRHPNAVRRIRIGPMGLGGLRAVIDARLGRSFPRPVMTRIHDASGGNPFYALELARTLNDDAMTATGLTLPGSLAALVSARLGNLDADVQELLLAAACLGAPTVALVAAATNRDRTDALALLEAAEDQGVVGIDGARLHFTHPLLATGVYAAASPARRRRMHRLLAGVVSDPELQARHLALAATSGDEKTLTALDAAAKLARRRGAPAAAAELVDLAVRIADPGHGLVGQQVVRQRSQRHELAVDLDGVGRTAGPQVRADGGAAEQVAAGDPFRRRRDAAVVIQIAQHGVRRAVGQHAAAVGIVAGGNAQFQRVEGREAGGDGAAVGHAVEVVDLRQVDGEQARAGFGLAKVVPQRRRMRQQSARLLLGQAVGGVQQ